MIHNPSRRAGPALATAAILLTAACGDDPPDGAAASTGIENCGVHVTADDPQRVVTLNQGATEIALALGFADRLIGTAYLDDEILPELAADYESVPVLADEYPSTEALYDLEPDFVYGSYPSAFGADAAGDRTELAELGVGSYLSPAACPTRADSSEPLTFDLVHREIGEIAALFGDPAAGDALVEQQRASVEESYSTGFADVSVFWWDGGTDAPYAGACCGGPGMIINAVGADNVFDEVAGSWANVGWESVIGADPDVIVLVDAAWDTAADKRAFIESDPALAGLTAVSEERYVVIPFSASTPGVRNADAVGDLATALAGFGFDG